MLSLSDFLLAVLAAVFTYLLIRAIRSYAGYFGLVDAPGGRKQHERTTPLVGGICMMAVFSLALWFLPALPASCGMLFWALLLVFAVGMIDDVREISPSKRFIVQMLAALLLIVFGGVYVEHLGNLFGLGDIGTGVLAGVFTLVCFVGVINAVNMSDGLDGLAGGLALTACAWFGVLAYLAGRPKLFDMILILSAVLVGFLLKNMRTPWRKRAVVFMGDAGSMSLGLLLTYMAVELAGWRAQAVTPITAVWVLALPLIDMASVMLRRIRKGQSPFMADNEHLHHILLRARFTVGQTVALLILVQAVLGGIGVAGWYYGVPEYVMFYAFLILLGAYYYAMSHAWKLMRALPHPAANAAQEPGKLAEAERAE